MSPDSRQSSAGPKHKNKSALAVGILCGVIILVIAGYHIVYAGRVWPGVRLGDLEVGGMSSADLGAVIGERVSLLGHAGLAVQAEERSANIKPDAIEAELSADALAGQALEYGRTGPWYRKIIFRLAAPLARPVLPASVSFDPLALRDQIDAVAEQLDMARKDVRLSVNDTSVEILTDTHAGRVIDRADAQAALTNALHALRATPTVLAVEDEPPFIDPATAPAARDSARRMMASQLIVAWDGDGVTVSRQEIGSWIMSGADGSALIAVPDTQAISAFVAKLAARANVAFQKPKLTVENGKVIEFIPPRSGRSLDEQKTIQLIVEELNRRAQGTVPLASITAPMLAGQATNSGIDPASGITELIGAATTTFDGSPVNRISNIKNGVRFLSGVIIQPGEEFSTVQTLGVIDNTSGYLPELVIKGNQTLPEFGGGLCQVSTTLFRAVLNAGLPVTARRNHSYRVSYYEKDGSGRWIGPGLDATVYQPEPDFKFKNDTTNPVLVYGFVQGTRVTFELYGTKDGRTAQVIGPKLLTELAPGDPVYVETDTLAKGTVKQVEKPHAGGTTVATYTITYADGTTATNEFKSSYRRWPARYLVGTGTVSTAP